MIYQVRDYYLTDNKLFTNIILKGHHLSTESVVLVLCGT